ncbi:unnamed protein product, partial [Durusdinium trenchii]
EKVAPAPFHGSGALAVLSRASAYDAHHEHHDDILHEEPEVQAIDNRHLAGKLKRRQFHTVTFETAEYLTRVRWVKSDKAVRALIIFQKRRNGRLSADLKEILVVIPSKWKFISKIEEL